MINGASSEKIGGILCEEHLDEDFVLNNLRSILSYYF